MSRSSRRLVTLAPSGQGPYGLAVEVGPHRLQADEPRGAGGQDAGPDPYELVMAGLGACTAMTLRMYADRHQWPLERVEVVVQHVEWFGADGVKSDRFERRLTLTGPLSAEQRARLVEVAGRCPVSRTLQRGAAVTAAETPAG